MDGQKLLVISFLIIQSLGERKKTRKKMKIKEEKEEKKQ